MIRLELAVTAVHGDLHALAMSGVGRGWIGVVMGETVCEQGIARDVRVVGLFGDCQEILRRHHGLVPRTRSRQCQCEAHAGEDVFARAACDGLSAQLNPPFGPTVRHVNTT